MYFLSCQKFRKHLCQTSELNFHFYEDDFRILSFVALNTRLKRDTAYQCLDMCLHVSQAQFQASCPYRVLDAKLVSSCLSWPSRASPHLSLLLARRGVKVNTLLSVKPGPTGHPSLTFEHTTSMSVTCDYVRTEISHQFTKHTVKCAILK